MTTISPDEFPNRAFQLAYFLHRERQTAIDIATRALNKLQLAATAQGKRLYYRLTGRADARKARSKVSMGEPHLLQRLVYVESEEFERRKEAAAQDSDSRTGPTAARQSDLVVFFIKHLVRITTRRNSFYVTLGLSRLLYNYTTPETMELYNLVIQDPDRVHDDYYYRSRKGLLLKELKERFGALVEVAKGTRGEQRWRAEEDNLRHASLVRECLAWFTPWATPCAVPERFDPLSDTIDKLNFEGRHPDEEHEVEVNRIHAALHPECFARLAAASRLASPDDRLELPHFFLATSDDDDENASRTPPHLSQDELHIINDLLAREATRRKSVSAGFLEVLVDGVQRAEIHLEHAQATQFLVDEDAELIEVYSSDPQGALLLATHLLNFSGADKQNFIITVEGGQRIEFTAALLRDANGSTTGARVAVAFRETAPARAASLAARRLWTSIVPPATFSGWWKPASAFAVLALLVAGSWWVWTNRQDRNPIVKVTPAPAPTVPTLAPSPAEQKGNEPQRAPSPPVNQTPRNESKVAPAPVLAQREPNTRERDENFVGRSLLPNSSANAEPDEVGTRGVWDRKSMGKPLGEVRRVHVQVVGGIASGEKFLTELRTRLTRDSSVQLSDADQADAALKISVQPASSRADDPRMIVVVRAVNANGYVVWPASRRGSSWRYVGQPGYVAERIVTDLTRDIEGGKPRQTKSEP
jgi:hypothetical protein